MPRSDPSRKRCAIYTRKSSEEGLEQEFNSLQAQSEACEAYIRSQHHEGWVLARTRYDDGGLSGGSMARPGLQRLLADIQGGRIDIIVVYKVDRLTRSLADFARLVEIFDAQGVSFVSVTQQFNTTSSMGRLTLNVLLSFAQFEREVTGERIRDKIAASKKKGMWMGGNVPLGYDASERTLIVNPAEAETVRRIFALYRELGCVRRVKEEADRLGLSTKRSTTASGTERGGTSFSRGHIYKLLANPVYSGQIAHKGQLYPGQHPALIDTETWTVVRDQLATDATNHRHRADAAEPSLLAGMLVDARGGPAHPIARRQERPTLSLLRLRCLDHAGGNGLRSRMAAARPGNRRRRDQGLGRRADQPSDAARAVRYSRHTQRPNPENARSCNPPCRRPRSLPSAASQGRSRPRREGYRRAADDHDQGPAQLTIGRGSRVTLIGEPERQPYRAYSARGIQAPRCRNEAGAARSGNTERPPQM